MNFECQTYVGSSKFEFGPLRQNIDDQSVFYFEAHLFLLYFRSLFTCRRT